mgnify:CR=1 FL=1
MQGELTVADAASSRYRGRISTEIIRDFVRIGFRENDRELFQKILLLFWKPDS